MIDTLKIIITVQLKVGWDSQHLSTIKQLDNNNLRTNMPIWRDGWKYR